MLVVSLIFDFKRRLVSLQKQKIRAPIFFCIPRFTKKAYFMLFVALIFDFNKSVSFAAHRISLIFDFNNLLSFAAHKTSLFGFFLLLLLKDTNKRYEQYALKFLEKAVSNFWFEKSSMRSLAAHRTLKAFSVPSPTKEMIQRKSLFSYENHTKTLIFFFI